MIVGRVARDALEPPVRLGVAAQLKQGDCQVDDAVVYSTASGAVINDAVVTNLITATMVREGSDWKVALAERTQKWPGVVECGA